MLLSISKCLSAVFLCASLAISAPLLSEPIDSEPIDSEPADSEPIPNFVIKQASLQLRDNIQYLMLDADFGFSEPVLDALHNGVAMVIVQELELYRIREYIWDKKVAVREQRFILEYFDLSEQYVISNNHSGEHYTAMTLQSAINILRRDFKQMAVIDNSLLSESRSYYAKIRVRLSLDSLPVPLQLNAFISAAWWLYSDWYISDIASHQTEAG